MSMFGYGLFVGAFFSNGKVAAIFAIIFFYLTSFLYTIVQEQTTSESLKNLLSIFPTISVQLAGINMLEFESLGVGLSFENANELYKNYRFSTTIWMNLIYGLWLGIIGLYLENVLPSAVGVRKPFYFLFTKSYWCGTSHSKENQNNKVPVESKLSNSKEYDDDYDNIAIDSQNFEAIPDHLRRKEDDNQFIQINNLSKKFGSKFYAINNLTVEMFEDQIFALLGHNGAGKTTTINVLCGMMSASEGKASIYGYNVPTEMKEIRKMMGICPQHNILFPKLTVKEHLSIFADFKGMPKKEINEEIEMLLKDLNLKNKENVLSMNLSGGYKRKLSLGIALVGGSKVVFLDEPSSGMDVTARREMWDMLKKYRNDRIIILTTHYMEEADNLGDRIGIMSHGKMLWWGSPDFLKNRFGDGYNLVVVKLDRDDNEKLERFVLDNVPGSSKLSEVSSEVTFLLPKTSSQYFAEFFKKFDQELPNLDVSSYGISMITLEEVFLKVEDNDASKNIDIKAKIQQRRTSNLEDVKENNNEVDDYSISKSQIEGGCRIFWLHFIALIIKRFLLSRRNFKGFVLDLLLPGILVIAGFGLSKIDLFKNSNQRTLEPSLFPPTQRVIYNTNGISGSSAAYYSDLMNLFTPSSDFTFTATTSTIGSNDTATLENFDDILYNAAQASPLSPYRYGHYYLYNLDYTNHQYKVVSFINNTSQDAHVAFPHFMYQAIMRKEFGSSFSYTMINDPMPIVQIYKDIGKTFSGLFIIFVLGIAFALIPTTIIGFLISEKVNALVHQQIISGMNRYSYWISNFIYDIVKFYVPILITISSLYIFSLQYDYAWLLQSYHSFFLILTAWSLQLNLDFDFYLHTLLYLII